MEGLNLFISLINIGILTSLVLKVYCDLVHVVHLQLRAFLCEFFPCVKVQGKYVDRINDTPHFGSHRCSKTVCLLVNFETILPNASLWEPT